MGLGSHAASYFSPMGTMVTTCFGRALEPLRVIHVYTIRLDTEQVQAHAFDCRSGMVVTPALSLRATQLGIG